MNKISVIGLESEKLSVMKALQRLGAVEINEQSEKLQDPEWTAITTKDSEEDLVSQLESELARTQTVLDVIDKYDNEKKPLFHMRRHMTEEEYNSLLDDGGKAKEEISEIFTLYEKWNDLKSRENSIESTKSSLMPWMSYELPLDLSETRSVRIMYGVIPAVAEGEALKNAVSDVSSATEVSILGHDQEQQYISVLCMKEDEDDVVDALKKYGFTHTSFKDITGTAAENMTALSEELESIKKEEEELEAKFAVSKDTKNLIQGYYDELVIQRDRAKSSDNLLKTKTAFYFDGWVPVDNQEEVIKCLDEFDCNVEVTEPEKGEETPVLMKENSVVNPLTAITELYSLPKSYEVDPTPIFAIFYVIFFGMMFADIAYGIILMGLTLFALYRYKLEGMSYRLVKSLFYCGISTTLWGIMFGSFFGDLITIKPLWIDPLDNAMTVLVVSCILGVIHLFVGMGIKAYMQIKDGKVFDAICDNIIWYVFIIGIALWLFGNNYIAEGAGKVGMYMTIFGGVWIVACEFIRGKGVGKLIGLWNLYGTTNYLADILSYSRLLALGLASAVIAQVFNMLGRLLGGGVFGTIGFIIIFLIGHTVNFGINALGAFVHASRLQYVEFFGKFYEGGGVAFKPFERTTKYVKFVKEDK